MLTMFNYDNEKDNKYEELKLLSEKIFSFNLDFTNITKDVVNELKEDIIKITILTCDKVAKEKILNFDNVVQPLINLDIIKSKVLFLFDCQDIQFFGNNKEIRDVRDKAREEISSHYITEDVFYVLDSYKKNMFDKDTLTLEEQRYFEKLMLDYTRMCMYIEDEYKDKISYIGELYKKLDGLELDFKKNIISDNIFFEKNIYELKGMPKDWLDERKVKNKEGLYKVTLEEPDYFSILDYCENRETRKEIYNKFNLRSVEKNIELLTQAVIIRSKIAETLGYKNFADYNSELKMIKNSNNASRFIDDMMAAFSHRNTYDLKKLTEFANNLEQQNIEIMPYDVRYYEQKIKEKIYSIDKNEIKKYFPVDAVVNGTFEIYSKLLGLKFEEVKTNNKWHEEIKLYNVYNYNHELKILGDKIGSFYTDLFPRDGKHGGATTCALIPGCDVSKLTNNNERQLPLAAMVCNFSKECLDFEDNVVVFFHEFGHIMHFICSKTQLLQLNVLQVEKDFVEVPSQMFENWCFNKDVLKILSSHIETGEHLPEDKIKGIIEAKELNKGMYCTRQLILSKFDIILHSMSSKEAEGLDVIKTFYNIVSKYSGLPQNKEDKSLGRFWHLMGGYEAGYFGYLYSLVISCNLFEKFEDNLLCPKTGMEYRKYILEPGATKDAIELIEDFLGKKPTNDIFYNKYNIKSPRKEHKKPKEKITI